VTEQAADARRICELLGIDAKSIDTEAEQAIPTPKGWAALSVSGSSEVEECPFDVTPQAPIAAPPTFRPRSRRSKRRRGKR
jgi:hypothetical protein